MKRILLIIMSAALLLATVSCEKEIPSQHIHQMEDGTYECVFYITPVFEELSKGYASDNISLEFHPLDNKANRIEPYIYRGELIIEKEHVIRFRHGKDYGEYLPDGKYLMRTVVPFNGKYMVEEFTLSITPYGVIVSAHISANYDRLDPLFDNDTTCGYPGSESNPYVIKSRDDYFAFCSCLRKDETAGRGKYFIQQATFEVGISGALAEDGWFGADFAGTYSGEGESVTIAGITFNGSDMGNENHDIGLFRVLKSGATFKNLVFYSGDMEGINYNGGVLAGRIEEGGSVKISDCSFRGSISGSSNIGGIIGYMSGGALEITDCNLGTKVTNSGSCVGGVVGLVEGIDTDIRINGLVSREVPLTVKANKYVGGIFGRIANARLYLENVDLANETTQSGNEVILGADSYVGGLAGELLSPDDGRELVVKKSSFSFPIKGADYVGGLIGKMNNVGYTLTLDNVRVSSNLSGSKYVGGFIGATDSLSVSTPLKITMRGKTGFGVINSNITGVAGEKYVGGVFGYVNNLYLYAEDGNISVMTSVTGSGDNVGGLIGALYNNTNYTISLENFTFSPQSEIRGRYNVGGVCGYMENAYISGGRYKFRFDEGSEVDKILSQKDFEEKYIGTQYGNSKANVTLKVYGKECVGGIAGRAVGEVVMSDVYVISEVSGDERTGGAVGELAVPEDGSVTSVSACDPNNSSVGYYFERAGSDAYLKHRIEGVVVGAPSTSGISANKVLCGGIVGRLAGTGLIAHCVNYAKITNGSKAKNEGGWIGHGGIAGLIGSNDPGAPLLYYCVNVGEIVAESVVGGVCGSVTGSADNLYLNIQYCANFGKITCTQKSGFPDGNGACGGVLGDCNKPGILIVGCANHGDLVVKSPLHGLGGIVGVLGEDPTGTFDGNDEHNGVVIGCANTGNISNENSSCDVGGIVGWMEEGYKDKGDASVLGSYNKGRIYITSGGGGRGGIVGYVDRHAEIRYCISFVKPDYDNGDCNYIWGHNKGDYSIANNYMQGGYDRSYADLFNDENASDPATFPNLHLNESNSYWNMYSGDPHPQIRYCPFQNTTYTAAE